ncbi:hypothetical protein DOY81_002166 [Sarcophaga bullata]|nr:hypothetical protein DOY81_002166 [Sarcophaga bullata]
MLSILDCLPRANRATLVFLLDHLSLVVSNSERNKMSAQALATVMGPPLMLHSASVQPGSDIDHAQPIAVLKYLLQIWPQPQTQTHHQSAVAVGGAGNIMGSMTGVGGSAGVVGMGSGLGAGLSAGSISNMAGVVSGRRGESTGQRGSKVSALQVDRQAILLQQQAQLMAAGNLLRSSTSVTNILSQGQHQLSATVNNHLYQSVVGQLAQSHRALQQAVQQPHQLVDSVGSAIPDQSPLPLPGTPSPGSSSASTGSGSGSGKSTDTIKRGVSPSSVKQVNIHESVSSYSLSQRKPDKDYTSDDKTSMHSTINHSNSIMHNNNQHHQQQQHQQLQQQQQQQYVASTSLNATTATVTGSTQRKGVDFYEPHKTQTKNDDDNNGVGSGSGGNGSGGINNKYGDTAYKLRSAYGSSHITSHVPERTTSTLSTEEYKAMRNKSSNTSSSSSSQATVLSAGSTGTSATTTSSDDSDDLISYKSSASTNALLAQSQAMTTSQLMSKYLKREPRVQFTPIKSPDSPSPPGGDTIPRGTYHLTSTSNNSSNSKAGKFNAMEKSEKTSSPSRQVSGNLRESSSSSTTAVTSSISSSLSSGSSSIVSTGRRLFDSLASEHESGRSTLATSTTTSSATAYNSDIRNSVANSSHISNKSIASSEQQPLQQHRSYGSSLFSTNGTNGTHTSAMHVYGTLPKHSGVAGNGSGSITGATLFNTSSSAAYTADGKGGTGYTSGTSTATGTASSSGVSSMTGSTSSYDFYTNSNASSSSYSNSSSMYATTSRPYSNGPSTYSMASHGGGGSSNNGAGNYHTLGTYRVQYAATNPFLDAFDVPSNSGGNGNGSSGGNGGGNAISSSSGGNNGGGGGGNGSINNGSNNDHHHQQQQHRSSAMAAFHSSESKNGSDEYDDLK